MSKKTAAAPFCRRWVGSTAMRSTSAEHGAPFVKLSEARRTAILESLDGAEDPELKTGAEFFKRLKRLTVEGYHTSKIGIDELNKDGVPATFACTHASHG